MDLAAMADSQERSPDRDGQDHRISRSGDCSYERRRCMEAPPFRSGENFLEDQHDQVEDWVYGSICAASTACSNSITLDLKKLLVAPSRTMTRFRLGMTQS